MQSGHGRAPAVFERADKLTMIKPPSGVTEWLTENRVGWPTVRLCTHRLSPAICWWESPAIGWLACRAAIAGPQSG